MYPTNPSSKRSGSRSRRLADLEAPAWLEEALQTFRGLVLFETAGPGEASASFAARCREAAESALAALRLRKERQRTGFFPLPLAEYLRGLARAAKVDFSPLLAAFGLDSLEVGPSTIRPLARLCQRLGLPPREASLHLGLGLLGQLGVTPAAMMAARRRSVRGDTRDPVADCEQAVRQAADQGGASTALRALEAEVWAVYEEEVITEWLPRVL